MYDFDTIHQADNNYYKNNNERNKELFGTDKVLPFWIADMDFKIAKPITQEIQRIAVREIYAYEFVPDNYFETIANWFNTSHNYQLKPHYFLTVPGILTGIAFLIEEFSNKGDNILIQTPVYHQFNSTIEKTGRNVITNSLHIKDNKYQINFDDLESKLADNTIKIMIICNPHNPIGRVWNQKEIDRIVELAQQYNILLISDEVHSEVIFDEHRFHSLTQYNLPNIISVLGSSGKTFGLQSIATGFFYINNQNLRTKIEERIEALHLNHGNTFSRYATYAAYKYGREWHKEMLLYVQQNYTWIQAFIKEHVPIIKILPLEGTYLIWLDFRDLNLNQEELEELVFQKAGIGLATGKKFGKDGVGFMRMTIATPLSIIEKAFNQLKDTLENENI